MRAYCSLTLCLMLVVTLGVSPVGGAVGHHHRPEEGRPQMNGSLPDVIKEKHLFPEDGTSHSQQQWQHLLILNTSNGAQAINKGFCPVETNSSRLSSICLAAESSQSFGQDELANTDVSELRTSEAADARPSRVTNAHFSQPTIMSSQSANSTTNSPLKSSSLVVITPVTESIISVINTSLDSSLGSSKPDCPILDFSLQAPSTALTAAFQDSAVALTYIEVFEAPVLGLYLVVFGPLQEYKESRLHASGTAIGAVVERADVPLAQQTSFLTLVQLSKGQRLFTTVGPARSIVRNGQGRLGVILVQKY